MHRTSPNSNTDLTAVRAKCPCRNAYMHVVVGTMVFDYTELANNYVCSYGKRRFGCPKRYGAAECHTKHTACNRSLERVAYVATRSLISSIEG